MFPKRPVFLLLFLLLLSSCADNNFFQKDALATPEEIKGKQPAGPDSVWVVAGRHYNRSGFYRFFWGNHNRKLWATPVKLPVFHLNKVKGGLKVVKKGGGFQTTSFHLKDNKGRLYAFRSIDKDPIHVVSKFWRPTFVSDILRDQTSAANPYGALVVPTLAQAVGVHHTNPALYYVPENAPGWGEYANEVAGKIFMLEEKYEDKIDLTASYSKAVDFEDSDDALRERFEHNTHHFDQRAFAKARLLDLLLGDWDRHKGQWDWAVRKQENETYYLPIPKDRDQVFMEMGDGLLPAIATSKIMARKFHSFDHDFSDVKAYMINSRFLDERLLNELTLQDWQNIARQMQQQLTDSIIERAVHQLPPPIYSLIGQETARNLKSRRNLLTKAAEKMYDILAESVSVAGSDEEEYFKVARLDDNRTDVKMYRKGDHDKPTKLLYHRVFYRDQTKQIKLYGLADDDVFELTGNVKDGILIKIYGGLGADKITDNSNVYGLKKYTQVYDTERGNEIVFGTEAKDKTTRDVRVHAFDREGN
ncbi:hypothetical protein ACSX1A_08600 [Pontibacter sp. MBLB2868]|uniref:hypothetical protein n=1 Tax=Pontibacter sp. MBLB2868 TaxID=3451555 RepID=UPI003F756A45